MLKKTPLLLVALAACAMVVMGGTFLPASAESVYMALPEAKVNKAQKDAVQKAATALMTSWSQGKFQPLPDSFTAQMQKDLSPEAQKVTYEKVKKTFGDFISMTFAEAGTSPKVPGAVIYRFKGTFAKSKEKQEVRVVVNDKGKIAGFFVLKWNTGI